MPLEGACSKLETFITEWDSKFKDKYSCVGISNLFRTGCDLLKASLNGHIWV